jgi:O-antigen/teichoic acid export membrane protein
MFLVIEGKVRYVPVCAFVGLLTSLGLGWFLIPSYGLLGAAISGLGSLFISNFVAKKTTF